MSLLNYLISLIRQCWEQLIWLDPANYAGIQGKLPNEENQEPDPIQNQDDEDVDDDVSFSLIR